MNKKIVLTPVAERDVPFYIKTALELKRQGQEIVFFSLYQPGNKKIRSAGFQVYDIYENLPSATDLKVDPEQIQSEYSIPNLQAMIQHEKLTFNLQNEKETLFEFIRLLLAADKSVQKIESDHPQSEFILIQELAGFLAPLAVFYATKRRNWQHYFTEPGFFKGHIHFLKNSLNLEIPQKTVSDEIRQKVEKYIQQSLQQKTIVAASKDQHHYKDMGLSKIFTGMNLKNLYLKLYYKYICRHQFVFSHIRNHVFRYLRMLKNRYENSNYYSQLADLPKDMKLVYFPFHVQLDFSLTIRSPQFLDQLSIIEKVLEKLPSNALLVAKEHPASIGCLDQKRLHQVLKHPQFRLLFPKINSYDVLEKCALVLTINSKVGAEALCLEIPVISFGKAFYTNLKYTSQFENWPQTFTNMKLFLESKKNFPFKKEDWIHFLGQVWQDSYPIELYDNSPENIKNFAKQILSLTSHSAK